MPPHPDAAARTAAAAADAPNVPNAPDTPVSADRSHAEDAQDAVLALDAGEVHVRLDGPRDAPALVLVHGSASSAGAWSALVPLLTSSHRVVRIDLPGHGSSGEPAGGDYAVEEQAAAVGQALDLLGVDRAVVAGHSSGGYTAVALAEKRPGLVSALVLVNTGPSTGAYLAPESAAIDPAQWPPSDEQLRGFASSAFRNGFRIPQELVDELRGIRIRAVGAAMGGSLAYLGLKPVPDRLIALGTPVQVLFGDQDRRWRPASFADYRAVPGADVRAVPGSGHTPIIEDPRRTADLMLAFAALHRTGGSPAG
ncbi:Pimeloyl-ACP methyl ester carboxylesterase [Actinacidiphila rubida]|uniref:Pimeloyl-ACP methyl ester carboxylesterase n=3 Tax=Actinacidiphila rubida TaxID=310780 RepID=A0A1H8LHX2_9ACTN|nr:Pimeloyl-ACP methyl ester carboxylesterase [Actinacidiphila rubida]